MDPTLLRLLGGFSLRRGPTVLHLGAVHQRLIALLALHELPLGRAQVAGLLWPEVGEERASGNLRSVLWTLRGHAEGVVVANGDSLALAPGIEVDARRARTQWSSLLERGAAPAARVELDPRLLGELLPGWYDDWVLVERERLGQLGLYALELLCDRFAAEERFGEAVLAGLAAVAREPLRESAHRALARVHLAEGNIAEALRRYDRYAELSRRELGVEPSARFRALVAPFVEARARAAAQPSVVTSNGPPEIRSSQRRVASSA
jgi:DNA-binding SARP family transcriptional activator